MEYFYISLFIVGVILVLLATVGLDLGDLIGVETLSLACFLVSFGGMGHALLMITKVNSVNNLGLSLVCSILFTAVVHFIVVIPMRKTETSSGISQDAHKGDYGVVITTIPANGYGEILMQDKISRSNQIAQSFHKVAIPENTRVIIIDIIDGVYSVVAFPEDISVELDLSVK
ncbi:putative membrane protein YuaF [compost metagenome]